MIDEEVVSSHAASTVLDLAYQQYSVQWQRIGNMQASAGGVLTVLAIIASLLVAVTSQLTDINEFIQKLGYFSYSFYISFLFSFIYLFLASYYTYKVVKPKTTFILKDPVALYKNIKKEVSSQVEEGVSVDETSTTVDLNMLFKVNEEISSLGRILSKNQIFYKKCLLASFMSLGTSFIALGHIIVISIFGSIFAVAIIGTFGYFCVLGIIPLITDVRKKNENS